MLEGFGLDVEAVPAEASGRNLAALLLGEEHVSAGDAVVSLAARDGRRDGRRRTAPARGCAC